MHRIIVLALAVGAVACEAEQTSTRPVSTPAASHDVPSTDEAALLIAVRRAREAGHACTPSLIFPPLPHQTVGIVPNRVLASIARTKVDELVRGAEFSHGEGRAAPEPRAYREGYRSELVGELLAKATANADSTVRSWVRSPGHCRSLLSPRANQLGAAHARDARGIDYWVLELGQSLR